MPQREDHFRVLKVLLKAQGQVVLVPFSNLLFRLFVLQPWGSLLYALLLAIVLQAARALGPCPVAAQMQHGTPAASC